MNNDPLKQYVALRQSLLAEKSKLEIRLAAINQALHSVAKAAPAVKAANTVQPLVKKARRKMSAAGLARIIAAQKARWAKIKGTATPAAKATLKTAAKPAMKAKKKISAAGRARIAAAQKARWAKIKAAKKA